MKSNAKMRMNRHTSMMGVAFWFLFSPTTFCIASGTFGGGSGTANYPFIISTAEHILELGEVNAPLNRHFIMTADINMSKYPGWEFNTIGVFTGVFDGNGHVIRNLTISHQSSNRSVGLFARITGANAEVKNLGLENVSVIDNSNCTGGLAGVNSGSITNCYVNGSVEGSYHVGGLVGYNAGKITGCIAQGSVSGSYYVGGLVGSNGTGRKRSVDRDTRKL